MSVDDRKSPGSIHAFRRQAGLSEGALARVAEDSTAYVQVSRTGFAERHGPTVLLGIGVVLVLAGLTSVFMAHQVVPGVMVTTGVAAIVAAAVLSRMEGQFKVLFLSGNLAKSSERSVQLTSGPPED